MKTRLNAHPFFLHSFLDEWIGSGIGNDVKITIEEFIKYTDKDISSHLEETLKYVTEIRNMYINSSIMGILVDTYRNEYTYTKDGRNIQYDWGRKIEDISSYEKDKYIKFNPIYNESFMSDDILKELPFPQDYSPEYTLGEYGLDKKYEDEVFNKIESIANKIIADSKKKPVFLPAGYTTPSTGHAVGIILTKDNVIVTNSGHGINIYHQTLKNTINLQRGGDKGNAGNNESVNTEKIVKDSQKEKDKMKYGENEIIDVQHVGKNVSNHKPSFDIIRTIPENIVNNDEENNNLSRTLDQELVSSLENYPQCIIFIDRPDDMYLIELINMILYTQKSYDNNDIDKFYAYIHKLYALQVIKRNNLINTCIDITSKIISEVKFEAKKENRNSILLKPSFKNTLFHIGYKYGYTIIDDNEKTKAIVSEILNEEIYKKSLIDGNFSNIKLNELIQEDIMSTYKNMSFQNIYYYCLLLLFFNKDLDSEKFDPFNIKLDSGYFGKKNAKLGRYCFMIDGILGNIYGVKKNKNVKNNLKFFDYTLESLDDKLRSNDIDEFDDDDDDDENNVDKSDVDAQPKYNILKEFKKIYYKDIEGPRFDNACNNYRNDVKDIEFTQKDIDLIFDLIKRIFNTSYIEKHINSDNDFSVFDHIDKMMNKISEVFFIKDIDNIMMNGEDMGREFTLIHLFLNLVYDEIKMSNNGVFYSENSAKQLKNQFNFGQEKYGNILVQSIGSNSVLSDIFSRDMKIRSNVKSSYFMREQYSGSCTFNGVILAASLLDSQKLAITVNNNLANFYKSYKKVKYSIRDKLLTKVKESLNEILKDPLNKKIINKIKDTYNGEKKIVENTMKKISIYDEKYSDLNEVFKEELNTIEFQMKIIELFVNESGKTRTIPEISVDVHEDQRTHKMNYNSYQTFENVQINNIIDLTKCMELIRNTIESDLSLGGVIDPNKPSFFYADGRNSRYHDSFLLKNVFPQTFGFFSNYNEKDDNKINRDIETITNAIEQCIDNLWKNCMEWEKDSNGFGTVSFYPINDIIPLYRTYQFYLLYVLFKLIDLSEEINPQLLDKFSDKRKNMYTGIDPLVNSQLFTYVMQEDVFSDVIMIFNRYQMLVTTESVYEIISHIEINYPYIGKSVKESPNKKHINDSVEKCYTYFMKTKLMETLRIVLDIGIIFNTKRGKRQSDEKERLKKEIRSDGKVFSISTPKYPDEFTKDITSWYEEWQENGNDKPYITRGYLEGTNRYRDDRYKGFFIQESRLNDTGKYIDGNYYSQPNNDKIKYAVFHIIPGDGFNIHDPDMFPMIEFINMKNEETVSFKCKITSNIIVLDIEALFGSNRRNIYFATNFKCDYLYCRDLDIVKYDYKSIVNTVEVIDSSMMFYSYKRRSNINITPNNMILDFELFDNIVSDKQWERLYKLLEDNIIGNFDGTRSIQHDQASDYYDICMSPLNMYDVLDNIQMNNSNTEASTICYNSGKLAGYYHRRYTDFKSKLIQISDPNCVRIIDKLEFFMGDPMNTLTQKYKNIGSKKKLEQDNTHVIKLNIGENKLTLKANEEIIDGKAVYTYKKTYSGADKTMVIQYKDGNLYIDDYNIITSNNMIDNIVAQLSKNGKTKELKLVENLIKYSNNSHNLIMGLNDAHNKGIIAFSGKTKAYYDEYNTSPWIDRNQNDIFDELNNMNSIVENLLYLEFSTDNFNIAFPKFNYYVYSPNNYFSLTFVLFCEYLMFEGKTNLFNILISGFISCSVTTEYITINNVKYPLNIHQNFLGFILQSEKIMTDKTTQSVVDEDGNELIPSKYLTDYKIYESSKDPNNNFVAPEKEYIVNKIRSIFKNDYRIYTVYNYAIREEYYQDNLQTLSYLPQVKDNKFDLTYYNDWLKNINDIIQSNNLNSENVLKLVNDILIDMEKDTDSLIYVSVEEISNKYKDIIQYITEETNYKKLVFTMQYNILQLIKKKITTIQKTGNDKEIMGNIKYFIEDTFDHNTESYNDDSTRSLIIIDVIRYIKLFELVTGKILNKQQFDFIIDMLEDEKTMQYRVFELLMGRGKTFVIIPCLIFIFMFTKKYQNIVSCMPDHLLNQSMNVISGLIPFVVDSYAIKLNVNESGNETINNLLSINTNKVILLNDVSIKCNLLNEAKSRSCNESSAKSKNKEKIDDSTQKGGLYIQIDEGPDAIKKYVEDTIIEKQNMMTKTSDRMIESAFGNIYTNNTLLILDEFDTMIDPMKSDLNYPDAKDIKMDERQVLNIIVYYITDYLFTNYAKYMLYSDRADPEVNRALMRKVISELGENKYKIIKDTYNLVVDKLEKDKIDMFKQITGLDEDVIQKLQKGGSRESLLTYFMREVYRVYRLCLSMMLDKDYGWDSEYSENPFIVIPYSSHRTPMKGSKFTDPIINVILTTITYYVKGFRNVDVMRFNEYIARLCKMSNIGYVRDQLGYSQDIIDNAMALNVPRQIELLDNIRSKDINQYKTYLREYLIEYVLYNKIIINKEILNCSFIDIIDPQYIVNKFAMSGTVRIHLPDLSVISDKGMIRSIKKDEQTSELIMKALYGENFINEPSKVHRLDNIDIPKRTDIRKTNQNLYIDLSSLSDENYAIIMSIIVRLNNYDVLIDVGSFLRDYSNVYFAKCLSYVYPEYMVVYFDDFDLPQTLQNGESISYDILNIKYEKKLKIYYDQKHTVGTDLDLPSTATSLTTINDLNIYSKVVQGLFRMREINYYQHNDFLIKGANDISIKELVDNIINREEKLFVNSKIKFHKQTLLVLLRHLGEYMCKTYKIEIFVPSLEMSDQIFKNGNFNHDYQKETFLNVVNTIYDNLKNAGPFDEKLKREIDMHIEAIKNDETQDHNVMVQKQTNVNLNVNINIDLEMNVDFFIGSNKPKIYGSLSYAEFLGLKDMSSNKYPPKIDDYDKYANDIFNELKEHNIIFTTRFLTNYIELLFDDKNPHDNIYIMKHRLTGNFVLMTSADKIVLDIYNNTQTVPYGVAERIDSYIPDNDSQSTINNIIMFMFHNIPSDEFINYMLENDNYREMIPKIGKYYKNTFKYKLKTLSQKFAKILEDASENIM